MIKLIGGLLILVSAVWLVLLVPRIGTHPEGDVRSLGPASGFSGLEGPLPESEVKPVLELARSSLNDHAALSRRRRGQSEVAAWLSFALSSVVTVIAGYLGRADPAASTTSGPTRLTRIIGVLAASATVATGASAKLKDNAEQERAKAVEVREALLSAQSDLAKTKDPGEARIVLERLRTAVSA